jgi:hypothetical protein
VGFLEIGDGEVEVTLGGGERAVAEDLLDVPEVRPVLEQGRGAGVPPEVAGDGLLHFRGARMAGWVGRRSACFRPYFTDDSLTKVGNGIG